MVSVACLLNISEKNIVGSHSCGLQTYGQFTLWSIFTGNRRNVFKIELDPETFYNNVFPIIATAAMAEIPLYYKKCDF